MHPFVAQGYDNTLCSLTMKRHDRPLYNNVVSELIPVHYSTLIDKRQLLDPMADDDDIDWKKPETPDDIIAMIKFSDTPWLKDQLRSLCREFIEPMTIDIDRAKWQVSL
jgi:hypothetical protein